MLANPISTPLFKKDWIRLIAANRQLHLPGSPGRHPVEQVVAEACTRRDVKGNAPVSAYEKNAAIEENVMEFAKQQAVSRIQPVFLRDGPADNVGCVQRIA
jgi:hypothetical protein